MAEMTYTCQRCGYETPTRCNIIRHLKSKTPCEVINNNIEREALIEQLSDKEYKTERVECSLCKKTVSKYKLSRHRKVCKSSMSQNMIQVPIETVKTDEVKEDLMKQVNIEIQKIHQVLQEHEQCILTLKQSLSNNQIDDIASTCKQHEYLRKPPKKSKISQAIRIVCWNTYIGEEIGKTSCLCCKTNYITQHNFHCGHVVAEANGGKVQIENLRPICAVCNNSMGTMDMKEFALENFNVEI
jgi:5-methylcytosine-specific restriction endonuclease McrA